MIETDGEVQRWNLLARWQARLIELPPLTSGNGAAECLKTYLQRKPAWRSLKEAMKANAQRAVIYSFRHSYSLRGHQRGIDPGSMAQAMGHSFEVHCRSYPWASAAGTIAAFQRANDAVSTRVLAWVQHPAALRRPRPPRSPRPGVAAVSPRTKPALIQGKSISLE